LGHWQYRNFLCNRDGRALFKDAVVVHLFRADPVRQFTSLHRALETGRYDFSETATRQPENPAKLVDPRNLLRMIDAMVAEDAGFRRLFVLEEISPIFLEFDQFVSNPGPVIEEIARALSVPMDYTGLNCAIKMSKPYGVSDGDRDRQQRLSKIIQ